MRPELVAGSKPALLLGREAFDAPPPEPTGRESVGRVVEVGALMTGLAPVALGVKAHGMDVDPPGAWRPQLDARRQPISLRAVSELPQDPQSGIELIRIQGQVEVSVGPGFLPGQGRDAPAAAHPVAHPGVVQGVQDFDYVRRAQGSRQPMLPTLLGALPLTSARRRTLCHHEPTM